MDVVRWLLWGAVVDGDGDDEDGWTPLFSASFMGHTAIARLLMERGADPTITTVRGHVYMHHRARPGWTPLMTACTGRNLKTVQCLLEHTSVVATINYRDEDGRTAWVRLRVGPGRCRYGKTASADGGGSPYR
jgi:ankyrin repeat protein